MTGPPSSAGEKERRASFSHQAGSYKWFVAAALGLAHTIAMVDRFVVVLISEPLRAAMDLSDTQLGLLQGTGFAILYCGFAIPLGCVADAANRRNLIMVGLSLWSVATVAAAFTTTFATLFATRILVGMGEACLIPGAMSLLVAYFTPATLARGTSIFGLGANFGYGLTFLGGGAILAALQASGGLSIPSVGLLAPWQGIFLFAGSAAIPVIVMLIWLREPPRPLDRARGRGRGAQLAAIRQGIGYLRDNLSSYAPFLVVGAMSAVTGYAMTSWSSSMFVRVHGMSASDAGKLIGLIGIIAGPLGTISGGYLLDGMRTRGVVGAQLVIMGWSSLAALTTAAGTVHAPNLIFAGALFGAFMFQSTVTLPSLYVGMQMLTPDRYRGVSASFNMMTYTLVGLGIGPTAVGALSDRLTGRHGLANAIIAVESAMALTILPMVFLSRRRFDARMRAVASDIRG